MTDAIDWPAVHKTLAPKCFNAAWDLLDLEERSAAQEEELLRLTMTSHYHWTQRADCTDRHRSVANWQVARVFAVLGEGRLAMRYGAQSLACCTADVEPFYRAYAYEAIARGATIAVDDAAAAEALASAREWTAKVDNAKSRAMLEADLETLAIGAV
jgi:hypothetical protein